MSNVYFTILLFYLQQKESPKQQCFCLLLFRRFLFTGLFFYYLADSVNGISPSLLFTFKVGAEAPTWFS